MQVILSRDDLRPLVESVIAEMLDRFGTAERIAYPEAEAAAMLGVKSHVLRDARLRGEITGAKLGRGYTYSRLDILTFLDSRRGDGGRES